MTVKLILQRLATLSQSFCRLQVGTMESKLNTPLREHRCTGKSHEFHDHNRSFPSNISTSRHLDLVVVVAARMAQLNPSMDSLMGKPLLFHVVNFIPALYLSIVLLAHNKYQRDQKPSFCPFHCVSTLYIMFNFTPLAPPIPEAFPSQTPRGTLHPSMRPTSSSALAHPTASSRSILVPDVPLHPGHHHNSSLLQLFLILLPLALYISTRTIVESE
jgi:hypothetical protein